MPAPESTFHVPARLADRYRIGTTIGTGGHATVVHATDALLQREVAIKVFKARADTAEALRVQETEARLIASLNHHALTTLYDAGVDTSSDLGPQVYLVMEYIPGRDLKQRLLDGPLAWFQVCWLGLDLMEGLTYLHEAGFLHRDLKPANVLLADREATTRLRGKLTDFGISSLIGADRDSGWVTGTAAYLSPEQVEDEDATVKSDVYSLGLVLLEALTARVAFPGKDVEEVAFARLARDPRIPSGIPEDVAALLRRLLHRDPDQRPTAREAADAFTALVVDDLLRHRGLTITRDPSEEAARLTALRSYNVLDTPEDVTFEEITALAARVLKTPIALVSLIDVDRVWFKSRRNFDASEVPRDVAFCSTTGSGDEPWTIPDATADDRTRHNPLVVDDPHVRSYAGAPLITQDGHEIGTVCVFDTEPRHFTADDLANLRSLATIVMRELELRRASRRAVLRLD